MPSSVPLSMPLGLVLCCVLLDASPLLTTVSINLLCTIVTAISLVASTIKSLKPNLDSVVISRIDGSLPDLIPVLFVPGFCGALVIAANSWFAIDIEVDIDWVPQAVIVCVLAGLAFHRATEAEDRNMRVLVWIWWVACISLISLSLYETSVPYPIDPAHKVFTRASVLAFAAVAFRSLSLTHRPEQRLKLQDQV